MAETEGKILHSTDIAGVCYLPLLRVFLGEYTKKVQGYEVIAFAWAPSMVWMTRQLAKVIDLDLKTVGLHGPIGKVQRDNKLDGFKTWIFERTMMGTGELVSWANRDKNVMYVLFHTPQTEDILHNPRELKQLKRLRSGVAVYVENDLWRHDIDLAVEQIGQLKQQGIEARLMLDVVHFMKAKGITNSDEGVRRALAVASRIEEARIEVGMHFPIGEFEFDSLKLEEISDATLRDVGRWRRERPRMFVVENQLGTMGSIVPHPGLWQKIASENYYKLGRLVKQGVLT